MTYQHAAAVLLLCLAPLPSIAQQSDVIDSMQKEIELLKHTVAEQHLRIERLEREASKPSGVSTAPAPSPRQPASPTQPLWHNKAAWLSITKGMSEDQVVSRLGRPTSVEVLGSFKTLFYRGNVGSERVSGNVGILDYRVWKVEIPVF